MHLMRPRVSDVYYPEAMRHIVRKRTATNKTSSQNNADILIWSAGWLLQFFEGERRRRKWSLVLIFRNLTTHRNGFFSLLFFSLCVPLFLAHFYLPRAPRMYVTVYVCGQKLISSGVLCLFWLILHFLDLIHCQIHQRVCVLFC